jgi:RNA polymerase sigma-70 factor (ECF subfamily)
MQDGSSSGGWTRSVDSANAASEDAELVRRARLGDREAFDALIVRHLQAAYGVAYALLREPADAEDACQDAFLTALRRIDDCRPDRFRGWLLEIVRNRAHNLRRAARVRSAEPLAPTMEAAGRNGAVEAELAEFRGHLDVALRSLTETQRRVLALHDVEGMPHREVAAVLAISEQSARVHLHRARRLLRRLLSRWYQETGHAD